MSLTTWGVLILALWVACRLNHVAKYYIKFFLFMCLSMVNATIFVPFMLHRPKDSKNGLLPSWACRVTARLILGHSYEVRGQENIVPEGQGCVVLINHQSSLDLVALVPAQGYHNNGESSPGTVRGATGWYMLEHQCYLKGCSSIPSYPSIAALVMSNLWPVTPRGCMVTRKEVLWLFPFGPACWLWGTVFIDKLNPSQAQKEVTRTGHLINSEQRRICMFPEGTRHEGTELLPFKKGAFHIAVTAQCPIQPVVVSKYHHINHKDKQFDSGHNIIEILPAISTRGLSKDDLPGLIERARTTMQDAYTRLSAESAMIRNQYN